MAAAVRAARGRFAVGARGCSRSRARGSTSRAAVSPCWRAGGTAPDRPEVEGETGRCLCVFLEHFGWCDLL
ncbi:hypothetical protein PR202_ga05346 [Eleusine coracana subsp. coracana]|uniref:Uncharacterized protein n=1 Tax=Eleusine coracana subsp. coracana TaxID=191504 RepID=A0AAV5BUC7_ELECO|nr:hypothetical protein PR202_ga04893 [Eleusine coracana subsp. coracana]GJM89183.1 hypothetical protein PR202_ga05346 [Eleusine coracana subsp. coracana]